MGRRDGIGSFYKKTDSTLRGNIGSELQAFLEASNALFLPFVPAYPANGRVTIDGRQYVQGKLLHQSTYGEDPQNPVRSSYIPDIIALQSSIPVSVVRSPRFGRLRQRGRRIVVFDARTDDDLRLIAGQLKKDGLLRATAGCAGFAASLCDVVGLRRRFIPELSCPSQLLIVCGSTNPVSLGQVEAAARRGMGRVRMRPEELLGGSGGGFRDRDGLLCRIEEQLDRGGDVVLQTARRDEDLRRVRAYDREHGLAEQAVPRLAARALGKTVERILRSGRKFSLVVFGGDTAVAVIEALAAPRILPIEQIESGVVLSRMIGESIDLPLITKAGGFGSPSLIEKIQRFVSGR